MKLAGEPLHLDAKKKGKTMSKFNIGDRVVLKNEAIEEYNPEEDFCQRGVVKEFKKTGWAVVEWDEAWQNEGDRSVVLPDLLISESEAEPIMSQLEEEYQAWVAPIAAKIKQAVALIGEADELAATKNKRLRGLYNVSGDLKQVMKKSGWNTSSWNC